MDRTARGLMLTLVSVTLPLGAFAHHARHPDQTPQVVCPMAVYFPPHGGAAVAVVDLLDGRKSSIRVAAYGLNHPSFVTALVAAKGRG